MYSLTKEFASSNTLNELTHDKTAEWWDGSMFESYALIRSPKSRGAAGEKLVSDVMEQLGSKVERSGTSQFDRIIDGHRTEIKVSTAWDCTPDKFRWSQIRNQPYDRILFCGVNPNTAKLAWATKQDLIDNIFNDNFRQHAGKDGGLDIFWVAGSIEDFDWMRPISTWNEEN